MISIEINSDILVGDLHKYIKGAMNIIVDQLKEQLELSTLKRIIITGDFTGDVIRVQKEYGSTEYGHTNKPIAVAVGKVLRTTDGRPFEQTIVLNEDIVAGLMDEKLHQMAIHHIHHEFCHVHDEYNQYKMFTLEGRRGQKVNRLEHLLISTACVTWSEYMAVRLSVQSFALNDLTNTLEVKYLLELIEKCNIVVETAIGEYRYDGDINKLLDVLIDESSLVFKIAATALGYIDGIDFEDYQRKDIIELIDNEINGTIFYGTWKGQHRELLKLYDIYPNWNDTYQLKDLGYSFMNYWNKLGIFPEYIKDKDVIYVSVP